MNEISACIFDLDGVIVDTVKYHFLGWQSLANELGFDFTEKDNEKLKGVGRLETLKIILKWGGIEMDMESMQTLVDKKNDKYLKEIEGMTSADIFPGVVDFLQELQFKNIKIGLGSASSNAIPILTQLDLLQYFEVIVDGNDVTNGKPHPEVFLKGAAALKTDPCNCIVFEDAAKGVQAALAGGMYVVGVGNEDELGQAHHIIPNFINLKFDTIVASLSNVTA